MQGQDVEYDNLGRIDRSVNTGCSRRAIELIGTRQGWCALSSLASRKCREWDKAVKVSARLSFSVVHQSRRDNCSDRCCRTANHPDADRHLITDTRATPLSRCPFKRNSCLGSQVAKRPRPGRRPTTHVERVRRSHEYEASAASRLTMTTMDRLPNSRLL